MTQILLKLRNSLLSNHQTLLNASLATLIVVHFFGLLGISSSYQAWFLDFTWLNLSLTVVLLLINTTDLDTKISAAFLLVATIGFIMEALGVATGVIFGSYYYGETLGIKFFGVPLTIALNWAALAFAAAFLVRRLRIPWALQAVIGGFIPVGLDSLMEPLCHILDFWYWKDNIVPLENYVVWYLLGTLFVGFFIKVIKGHHNRLAVYYLVILVVFFAALNISHQLITL
ncbi:MAG: carotenoid biosynthesis protein [Bacteroidota bacterium]